MKIINITCGYKFKISVNGYGHKKLLGSKHVNFVILDSGVEKVNVDESILPGYLGIPLDVQGLRYYITYIYIRCFFKGDLT